MSEKDIEKGPEKEKQILNVTNTTETIEKNIPSVFIEKVEEIGRPGQSIYERRVTFEEVVDEEGVVKKVAVKKPKSKPKQKEKIVKYHKPRADRNKDNKPDVLLISDVKDWAWWNKSQYLKKYLSDDFNIDCVYHFGTGRSSIHKAGYDVYVTFGYSYINLMSGIPKRKQVSGVTAHRPLKMISSHMKKVGWVHANSMMLFNELKAEGFKNLFYVPNGVDEKLFRPVDKIPINKEGVIAGYVGKECVVKGQKKFIEPAIKEADVESYSNMKNYRDMSPFKEMWKSYQKMDFIIISSTEDGTPNPALEAAACGRPIISNRIGNMPEFIENGVNGFLVNRNIHEYIKKIKWMKEEKSSMAEMGKNARKEILKNWTWKKQAENWREMLKKITEKV